MIVQALVFFGIYLILSGLIGVSLTVALGIFHMVFVPLLFKYSKTFQQQLVFLNYVQWPWHSDFSDPRHRGLEGGRNLYLRHTSAVNKRSIKIGVWHILPLILYERNKRHIENLHDQNDLDDFFNRQLTSSGLPIVIYCHGNANHRAADHRVKLYKVLQNMQAHVIAFDYRGYGDSSFVLPTENGVVEDSLVVYDWVRSVIDKCETPPALYVWGHSLGSGIASHLVGNVGKMSTEMVSRKLAQPDGLILESPFTNLRDEVANHFLTFMVRWLPYFETTIVSPFSGCPHYEFKSDKHLNNAINVPVLILHAIDDCVVPYRLGVKLYETLTSSRGSTGAPVHLRLYEQSYSLGHIWICDSPDLPTVLRDFMKKCNAQKTVQSNSVQTISVHSNSVQTSSEQSNSVPAIK